MKEFTKDDLKNGMVVTLRNGSRCIVLKPIGNSHEGIIRDIKNIGNIGLEYWLINYRNDLTRDDSYTPRDESLDIIEVRDLMGNLLWERKEKKKYTYEQLKEILGEEFEIVKE